MSVTIAVLAALVQGQEDGSLDLLQVNIGNHIQLGDDSVDGGTGDQSVATDLTLQLDDEGLCKWTLVPNGWIPGHNLQQIPGITLEYCQNVCDGNPECRSVELGRGSCFVNKCKRGDPGCNWHNAGAKSEFVHMECTQRVPTPTLGTSVGTKTKWYGDGTTYIEKGERLFRKNGYTLEKCDAFCQGYTSPTTGKKCNYYSFMTHAVQTSTRCIGSEDIVESEQDRAGWTTYRLVPAMSKSSGSCFKGPYTISYSPGAAGYEKFDNLADAQKACATNADCKGVTYSIASGTFKWELRAGAVAVKSSHGSTTYLKC